MPDGRPTFIDLRGEKYFNSPEELENFKKFMQTFNMMNEAGELFNSETRSSKWEDIVEVYIKNNNFYRVADGNKTSEKVKGEFDKLYVDVEATIDGQYRWNGSKFVAVNNKVSKARSADTDSDGKSIKDTYATKEALTKQSQNIANLQQQVSSFEEISDDALDNMFKDMFKEN